LGWDPKICTSSEFPGDAAAGGLKTILGELLIQTICLKEKNDNKKTNMFKYIYR
jgi:hypothetical protein